MTTPNALEQSGLGQMLILPRVKQYTTHEFDASGSHLSLTSQGSGGSFRLQTAYAPSGHEKAGVWYGSETRLDTEGEEWHRYVGHHVVDNFGNLVAVPA